MTEQSLSLAELFARDPRKHTDADIDTIIAELRERREKYILGDKAAGSPKPKSAAAKKREKLTGIDLDIKL